MADRARQPLHEMAFETGKPWIGEVVYTSVNLAAGIVACYLGASGSGGVPQVRKCTRGDTTTLNGNAFSALASRRVAGVVSTAVTAGNTVMLYKAGKCTILKENTAIAQGDFIGLSTGTAGYGTDVSGAAIRTAHAFGIAADGATASETTLDIWLLPWRM